MINFKRVSFAIILVSAASINFLTNTSCYTHTCHTHTVSNNNCHNCNHNHCCHNHSHNHNNCHGNCHNSCHNNCHKHTSSSFGLSFSFNEPTVYTYQSPVSIVEHRYSRPASTTRVVKTYSRPTYSSTTVKKTYSTRPAVYETKEIYTSPAYGSQTTVYETVLQEPVVCYETVEYRNHHPLRAITDLAGAMIDAFAD